jgi:hypothetical protein
MSPDFKTKKLVGEIKLSLASTLRITEVEHNDGSIYVDVRVFVPIQLGDDLMPTKKGIHISKPFVKELIGLLEQTVDVR